MRSQRHRSVGFFMLPLAWLAAMGGEIKSGSGYGTDDEPDGLPLSDEELMEVEAAKARAAERKRSKAKSRDGYM